MVVLAVVWLITRGMLWLWYQPMETMDSGGYRKLALEIATGDFTGYNGQRTPGYPMLIALARQDGDLIWLVQSVMGLLIALLVYKLLAEDCQIRAECGESVPRAPLLAGLLTLLALNSIFFEPYIGPETLSAFLLLVALYLFFRFIISGGRRLMLLASAAAMGILILARPQFTVLAPIFFILALAHLPRPNARKAIAFLLIALLPLLSWGIFNKMKLGEFTVTTLMGFNLTNHSGAIMEKAPDEYALYRDIYLKYRAIKIRETGSHAMTIFLARQELRNVTGLGEPELADTYKEISIWLFVHYPIDYLGSIAKSWVSFWAVPNYWSLEMFRNDEIAKALRFFWPIIQFSLRGFNVLLVAVAPWVLWKGLISMRQERIKVFLPVVLVTSVVGLSVFQALFEYGENPRYYIPSQALVIMVAAYYYGRISQRLRVKEVPSPI